MILQNKPDDAAILSNVGAVSDFSIKATAKSFQILSSGLYANKIRAIIRELSCNAVDSHTAAGRADQPFEVHLPSQLEPWFSIKDFGVGLSHDEVIRIYTTYFESTKTSSNEFIGALGLGSKSPFSYTTNFAVTAIKNGQCGVYTAFINEQGVPSIALMQSSTTDEPNGVEVKFGVDDRSDFDKFLAEAQDIFSWFAVKPLVQGRQSYQVTARKYETLDLIPGVHVLQKRYYSDQYKSWAVMGNIAYPIDMPNAEANLGALKQLLNCGLVMHFGIGELEFQASREGLSYVSQTISSIRQRLEAVVAALTVRLSSDADGIDNHWKRAYWLHTKVSHPLWESAVYEYIKNTGFELFNFHSGSRYAFLKPFSFTTQQLAQQFNIQLNGFEKQSRFQYGCRTLKPSNEGHQEECWTIQVDSDVQLVLNDTNVGAFSATREHWRQNSLEGKVFVANPADRSKPVEIAAFLAALHNPPADQVFLASQLERPERKERTSTSTSKSQIMKLTSDRDRYRKQYVWRSAGTLDQLNSTQTYYYLPLVGMQVVNKVAGQDYLSLCYLLYRTGLFNGDIYGVRQQNLPDIQQMPNWIRLEDHVGQLISQLESQQWNRMVMSFVDNTQALKYTKKAADKIQDPQNPLVLLLQKYGNGSFDNGNLDDLTPLINHYKPSMLKRIRNEAKQVQDQLDQMQEKYPLLPHLRYADAEHIAEYINLKDQASK
jgi:hypothetical protein